MQVLFFSFVYSFLISHIYISGVYNKYNFIILYWFHVRQYVIVNFYFLFCNFTIDIFLT